MFFFAWTKCLPWQVNRSILLDCSVRYGHLAWSHYKVQNKLSHRRKLIWEHSNTAFFLVSPTSPNHHLSKMIEAGRNMGHKSCSPPHHYANTGKRGTVCGNDEYTKSYWWLRQNTCEPLSWRKQLSRTQHTYFSL